MEDDAEVLENENVEDTEDQVTDQDSDDGEDSAEVEGDEDTEVADGDQAGEDDADPDDELVDVELDGKTFKVPSAIKPAILRQADYTRKTQDLAKDRAALDEERQALVQQATLAKEIDGDRVQHAVIESQLKALDALDWDKLEEDDPEEANRLFRQRQRIRDRQIELAGKITQKQTELDSERQRSAREAHAKVIQETQAVLQRDIKGWNTEVATKVGEFAVNRLGWGHNQVERLTDPVVIKTLHAAYLGDQALRRERQKQKLEAGDKTPPVRRPGGGGAAPNARRTTDPSGDKLSTDEWIRREMERTAPKRVGR